MNVAFVGQARLPTGPVVAGNTPDVFTRLFNPGVQLVLWHRSRAAAPDWIDALECAAVEDINTEIRGPDFTPQIWRLLCDAGYPGTITGQAMSDEIGLLAWSFSQLMSCSRLQLRLAVIEDDSCWKFHMDYVKARLLMPLSGPGTQWTDISLGKDAPIHQLDPGDVGIFKGRLWVEEPMILHRSPPIAGSGQTRLLLTLDPIASGSSHVTHFFAGDE